MKARQIATARTSVYALALDDRIHTITRGPDGLWGSWEGTAEQARHIVHGGDVVARIGRDGRVSVQQAASGSSWSCLDLEALHLAATRLPSGAPALFASDSDHLVWHTWKPTPDSPWVEWTPLAGFATQLAAGSIPGGGLVVFGIHDGSVYHRWQDHPLAAWKEWTPLGAPAGGVRNLAAEVLSGGGLGLFALGNDHGVYYRWQAKPFGRWNDWSPLGTSVVALSITRGPDGSLAVFTVGLDNVLRYRRQAKPFGTWTAWTELGTAVKHVAAQPSYTDGLEAFAIGLDDEVRHTWCDRLVAPWSEWMPLAPEAAPFRLR